MIMSLKTERLHIKPYTQADFPSLAELLTNDEIKRTFMIPDFKSEEELNSMVNKLYQYSFSDAHFERGIYRNDCLIGFVNDVEIDDGLIELGYVVHPKYQNNGYATEMLQGVISGLFQSGFSTIVTGAFVENISSIRVMQKCGMERIAKEEDIVYRGKSRHCIYYAATKPPQAN